MFDEFVADAVKSGTTDFDYETNLQAQQLLTQFNLEIDAIIEQHGLDAAGKAIWYCYGCVSGMIHDVLDETNADGWGPFYESLKSLYDNGFAKHCENRRMHALRQSEFGSAAYMLWDMDGIEYLTFERSDRRQLVEPLVDFGLTHDHAVVQESFLHCLGHRLDSHPEYLAPKIAKFLQRNDLQDDIREYALQCQTGMIL